MAMRQSDQGEAVVHFADDGKWPERSDDPRWLAILEGDGVHVPSTQSRAAALEIHVEDVKAGRCGRHTPADVHREQEAKRSA